MTLTAEVTALNYEPEKNEYGYSFDTPYYKWDKDDLVLKIVELENQIDKLTDNRPKLSARDVELIRRLKRNANASNQELAEAFGVNRATITRTINGTYHKN